MMKKKGKHTALILQKRTRTKHNMQKITGTKLIMQKRNTQSAYYANWYYLFLGGTWINISGNREREREANIINIKYIHTYYQYNHVIEHVPINILSSSC